MKSVSHFACIKGIMGHWKMKRAAATLGEHGKFIFHSLTQLLVGQCDSINELSLEKKRERL